MACVSNESGFISSGVNSGSAKCFFHSIWSRLSLCSSYFLKPVTSDTPPIIYLSVGGFLTSKGWPFNFTLTSDLVVVHFLSTLTTCHFLMSRPLHPTLPSPPCSFSLHTLLCQSHTRVIWPIFRAHTTFNGELAVSFLKPSKGIWGREFKLNSAHQWVSNKKHSTHLLEQHKNNVGVNYIGILIQTRKCLAY